VVTIIETPAFTKAALELIGEESLFELKLALVADPEFGVLIPGQKGLRKVRWAAKGKGKRGGSRVIYFYVVEPAGIQLLAIYSKNKKSDLSKGEYDQLQDDLES
jgi:mRNA-degrading endonuclease RelE of RelBE toxin-antitoxin system